MTYKIQLLRAIVTGLLEPIKATPDTVPPPGSLRASDPIWQVGHAAYDTVRALVAPFKPASPLISRFSDHFHGKRSREAWQSPRPPLAEIELWWHEILAESGQILSQHPRDKLLAEPVQFTAYAVRTLEEAFDYALYHSSFHFGRAHEILGIQ